MSRRAAKRNRVGIKMDGYYVCIATTERRTVLYTGMTNDLARRITEHKTNAGSQFTKRYNVGRLVYVEKLDTPDRAIRREKEIKGWRREKKVKLIEAVNPDWKFLDDEI